MLEFDKSQTCQSQDSSQPFNKELFLQLKKQFKDKKVLIQGLGLNAGGVGMVKFFARLGAQIRVTDLRDEKALAPSIKAISQELNKGNVELILGKHREEDFKWADVVVRNPAVKPGNKYIEIAKKAGAKIYMEISLFLRYAPGLVVGITGTRGKSTTTALVYEFLKEGLPDIPQYDNILLAGNIGKSAIAELFCLNDKSITVLEISSFQSSVMRENKQSVDVGLVTTIYPDHLNWHPDFNDYVESKRAIIEFMTPENLAVLNLDDEIIKRFAEFTQASLFGYTFSKDLARQIYKGGKFKEIFYYDSSQSQIHSTSGKIRPFKLPQDIFLKGKHNRQNILAAYALSQLPVFQVSQEHITTVLKRFKGLTGRQEFVATVKGVDFYNDTAATMDVAVKAAVTRFYEEYGKNLIFIMGGVDKGIDYENLVKYMKGKVSALVLFEGSASEKIREAAEELGIPTYAYFDKMYAAVNKAFELARKLEGPKKAVVLSPAGASFNMFLNEWDRGRQFVESVRGVEGLKNARKPVRVKY